MRKLTPDEEGRKEREEREGEKGMGGGREGGVKLSGRWCPSRNEVVVEGDSS